MITFIVFFLFIYFFIQFLIIKLFRKNITNFNNLIFFTCLIFLINFYETNYIIALYSIMIIYILITFFLIIPGVINLSPSLKIIEIIHKKKTTTKKLKFFFLKEKFVEKRISENINSKFVLKEKGKLTLSLKSKLIVYIANKILKIYNLKSDV